MLSSRLEHFYCHRRHAPLKLDSRAAHVSDFS